MITVEELNDTEIGEVLRRVGYGHLACSRDDVPYVIPVHFAYDAGRIVVYTTEGKKSEIIAENPLVCLQAEDVIDNQHWESVIVNGTATRLTDEDEREATMRLITSVNPTLTPAVSIQWLDSWVRENLEVIYVITPDRKSGRRAVSISRKSGVDVQIGRSAKTLVY